ncbi:ATP-binding protein [Desulforhabdus sp. TSK]|uniref:ATP-binding protein n=1 Tax=Desulforhabdus sp. TSK TaxID=2925014 RepID=UPI001FC7EA60|nr:ATP-binding protein [Desulforhabdus sp. TSK]
MKKMPPPLPPDAKCTRCRSQATIRLPNHHMNFCPDCFTHFFQTAVHRAMKKYGISRATPLLVAVSGGKDSLALWNVLNQLGHVTRGLHISLGIDDFSEASTAAVDRFAQERSLPWTQYSLKEIFGYDLMEIKRRSRRRICSLCGLLKRQMLNRLTIKEGFQVLVTGHNLDDEAGRLLGNLVYHRSEHLRKQSPFLPTPHGKMPIRFKPLYRLDAQEVRNYCSLQGIHSLEAACPLSRGATSHIFQEALNLLEREMPGTKRQLLYGYLERHPASPSTIPFVPCTICGEPTYEDTCSVCNLRRHLEKNSAKE